MLDEPEIIGCLIDLYGQKIKEVVRDSVEEMLKELLENEAESLMQAACYERSETRQGYHCSDDMTGISPPPPATPHSNAPP